MLTLLCFVFIPSLVYADAGIPMIFFTFPTMLMALIPIVFIEAGIYRDSLKIEYKQAIKPSFVSNLVSTILGIPLSWALLFGIELGTTSGRSFGISTFLQKVIAVTLQAAWLVPYEGDLEWMIPIAAMIGLIPAFFLSVFIEYLIVKRFFKEKDKTVIRGAVWRANIITYCILFVLLVIYLIYNVAQR